MSFDLKKLDDQTWQIFDHADQLMYSGSLENCRDWLDSQEGQQQRTFLQMVSGWFSKQTDNTPVISSTKSASESGVLS